jgi:SAM-dependent methyltransferase
MVRPHAAPTPSIVAWLGYGGLLPFVCLAATALAGGRYAPLGRHGLLTYGAVILSFVGAVNWGFAMTLEGLRDAQRARLWLWSVIPALLGWTALFLAPAAAAPLMVAGFVAQYVQDQRLARTAGVPSWYLPLRLRLTAAACLCLAVGALASTARADQAPAAEPRAPAYRSGHASEDGIGKFYEGREIARVMGFEGADWLERPTRDQEERPDQLVRELDLKPGMTVADVGAGSGYLSRRIAPLVAPGKVYAVDVQPEMVGLLRELSRQPKFANVVPTLGAADDTRLPAASLDLAVMVDVYHELEFPYEAMQSVLRAVKPGGRVVLVEYRAEDPAVPIKALHKMSVAQIRREMGVFPVVLERTSETLPIQHIVVFRKT